jgi:hypothetical protein
VSTDNPNDAPTTDRVTDDLECRSCGYNLRTLPWNAPCPECGTPVASSRLPPDFPARSFREARRIRLGLCLLIISALLVSLASTQFFLAMMHSMQLVEHGYTWLFSVSALFWSYGPLVAHVLQFAGIVLIAVPASFNARHCFNRLEAATVVCSAAGLIPHCIVTLSISFFGFPGWLAAPAPLQIVTSILSLGHGLSIVFVVACLSRKIKYPGIPRLLFIIGPVVIAALLVPGEILGEMRTVLGALLGFPTGITVVPTSAVPDDPLRTIREWATWLGSYSAGWRKHIGNACWIGLVLVFWLFIRRIDAAMRRTAT